MILNSPTISGSLTVTGNIIASGSITLSGSVASASYAATASFVALAQSASNAVAAATASSADNLLVRNTLTAQTLVVQTITSSVDFVTGSTRFGSVIGNTHVFTGSMSVSGSGTFAGSLILNSADNRINSGNELRFYRTDNAIYTKIFDAGSLAANGFTLDNMNAEGFHFKNNGTTVMRMNSSGNVGIGTSSPTNALHISGSGGNTQTLVLEGSLSSANAYVVVKSASKTYFSGLSTDLSNSFIIYDGTANTARIVITTSGSILAGNPTEYRTDLSNIRFSIFNSSSNPTLCVTNTTNGVGQLASIHFGQMINNGTDARPGGSIKSIAVGTYTGGVGTTYSADLAFYTSYQNSDTERIRITSAGDVYINGTASDIWLSSSSTINQVTLGNASYPLAAARASQIVAILNRTTSNGVILEFKYNGSVVGSISTNSNSLPSDLNFKKDISDISIGLNLITKLRPVHYRHKMDEDNEPLSNGIIAQEMEEALSECGIENNSLLMLQHKLNEKEGESQYWVDYTKMIPVLIKSIQELKSQNDALQSRIETLESK